MFNWRAVRFLGTPAIQDVQATIDLWYRRYSEYARQRGVRTGCVPEISEWISVARDFRPSASRRLEPCIGFTIGGVPNDVSARWPLSSIDMWFSEAPRLEWVFDDHRQILRRQFVRWLLRIENIHLVVHDRWQVCVGWNYAVYVWLRLETNKALTRNVGDDLDQQSRRLSSFLAAARSVAEDIGRVERISVRSAKDRRKLEAAFRGRCPEPAWARKLGQKTGTGGRKRDRSN